MKKGDVLKVLGQTGMLTLATEGRITKREIAKELGLGDRLILAAAWRHAAMLS